MKKLFLFIVAILLLSSCNNTPMEVKNPDKETTLEILKLAEADTTLVKVVIIKETLYVVKDNVVTHKVSNDSGKLVTLLLFILALLLIVGIIAVMIENR